MSFDEVVVAELVAGRKPATRVTRADRAEAVRRLAARRFSDGQTAYRLGIARRTAGRIRRRNNIAAGVPVGHTGPLPVDAPTLHWSRP